MYIVHITSELSPIAKAGGLGDMIYGLARAQVEMGNKVEILLPKYDTIDPERVKNWNLVYRDLWSFEDIHRYHNSVWNGKVDGLDVHFIEPHTSSYYFNRGTIYNTDIDIERFLYFSRTALEYLFISGRRPDVLHIHDWPTSIVAPLMKTLYRNLGFSVPTIIFTIHNIEYQGRCHPRFLTRIGLRGDDFRTFDRMQDTNDPCLINLMKGGITYADHVTTVSPKYADEIKTPEYGFALDSHIRAHQPKLSGILNGIDRDFWDPAKDTFLKKNYGLSTHSLKEILEMKAINRKELFSFLHMKPSQGPLIVSITRLVPQKGPRLILDGIHHTLDLKGSFVLLGSHPEGALEHEFYHVKHLYRDNPHLSICLEFNEALAHLIYAAADAILIPSLFEPCGLSQMIGMRYGTLPIVRRTGGLYDTVFDKDNPKIPLDEKTGFTFDHADTHAVKSTLDRVFKYYHKYPKEWEKLVYNGMSRDFSWKQSALEYETLYNRFKVGTDAA